MQTLLAPGDIDRLRQALIHVKGQSWNDRVAGWFEGAGCDVWAIQRDVCDPLDYVRIWQRDADENHAPERLAEWLNWFDDHDSIRDTEPHRLVTWGKHWYPVAWDVRREAWRTFRADRMHCRIPTGPRFTVRDLPGGDAAAFVADSLAKSWPYQATVRMAVGADSQIARQATTYGQIEAIDDGSCWLHFGADSLHSLVFLLGALEIAFVVEQPPELADQLIVMSERFRRAAGSRGV